MQRQEVGVDEYALIRRMARGDGDAAEQVFRAHGDAVYRYALRELNLSVEDAEEVTQDTFLSAIELAGSFDGRHPVLPWLFGIARLRIIDHFRKRRSLKRVPQENTLPLDDPVSALDYTEPAALSPESQAIQSIEMDRLVHAMESALLDDEREALLLHYIEGFSIREVSKVLERTEKAVKNLMTRGKQRLREAFDCAEVKP